MSLSTQIRLRTWRPLRKLTDHMRYFSSRSVGHHFKLYSVMLSKSEWRDSATGKTSLRWLCGCKNRHPSISYAKHSNEVEKTADLERIREMQKYFEQYTEEYVETEAEPEMLSGTSKTGTFIVLRIFWTYYACFFFTIFWTHHFHFFSTNFSVIASLDNSVIKFSFCIGDNSSLRTVIYQNEV